MRIPTALRLATGVLVCAISPAAQADVCTVVGVSDGDTLTVRCGSPAGGEQRKVRLAGVDAPEKRQPFGQRSRQALADLCFQQEAAVTPRAVDRYGRTVADVECRGQDTGAALVGAGWVWVYDRYAKGYGGLYPLQDRARQARAGLWQDLGGSVPPVAPWEWRQQERTSRSAASSQVR